MKSFTTKWNLYGTYFIFGFTKLEIEEIKMKNKKIKIKAI